MSRHQSPDNNNKHSEAARRKLIRQIAKTLGLDECDFTKEISYNQLNIIQKNIRHFEPLKYAICHLKIRIKEDRDSLSREVSKLSREKEQLESKIQNIIQENNALKDQRENIRQIFREELQILEERSSRVLDDKLEHLYKRIEIGVKEFFSLEKSEIYQALLPVISAVKDGILGKGKGCVPVDKYQNLATINRSLKQQNEILRQEKEQLMAENQRLLRNLNSIRQKEKELFEIMKKNKMLEKEKQKLIENISFLVCLIPKFLPGEKGSEIYQLGYWLSSALEKQGEERKMTLLEKNLVHKHDYNEAVKQLGNMIKILESALQKQTDDAEYIIENLQEANDHFRDTLSRIKEYVIKKQGQEEWEKIEKYLEQQYPPNGDSGR